MAKWITKANNEVLSFCTCEHPLAALPGQLDCPWCGCRYLFSCTYCRKAFTFGRIVNVDQSLVDLIAADRARGGYTINPEDLEQDADLIADMLAPFREGETIAYLDGAFFSDNERDVRFTGLFSHHVLPALPQSDTRDGVLPISDSVGQASYWFDRERDDGA